MTMSHTMNNDTHHCDNTVIDYITCMGTGDYIAIVQLFTPPAPVTLQARMKNNGEILKTVRSKHTCNEHHAITCTVIPYGLNSLSRSSYTTTLPRCSTTT